MKKLVQIGYMETQFSGVTKALPTRESFVELAKRNAIADIVLREIPKAMREGSDIRSLKDQLPLIYFMAHCEEGGAQPLKDTAIPTGLCMHDFDHLEVADIRAMYGLNIEPLEESLGILYAGITPSGRGLRLVTTMLPGENIPQCQKRVADALHLKRDTSVTNVSRGSYAVPFEYIIRIDNRLFTLPEQETGEIVNLPAVIQPQVTTLVKARDALETSVVGSVMPVKKSGAIADLIAYLDGVNYEGLPMKEIVLRLMEQICSSGVAKEGDRETTLFKMATLMRPITNCDFRYTYEILAPFFLSLGLSDEEVRHAISSGISQKGGYTRNLSPVMQNITQSIRAEMGCKTEPVVLPPYDLLPPLVNDILNCYPKRHHMAVLVSLMAMFGTLATGVRFRDSNRTHSLTFFVAILAQFGGGKGFIDDLMHKILPGLIHAKKMAIEKAEEERRERIETSNLQVRQKHSDYPTQILGDNITTAQLIEALNGLNGKHGFLCTEEISSLVGSISSEYGKQIAYIIKKGFDNGTVSKETKSDTTANVYFECFLNLILCGTSAMVMKFFNTATIEDGTASRFVFVDLDPGLDGYNPDYLSLGKAQQRRLDLMIEKLVNIGLGKEYQKPSGEVEKDVEYFGCEYLLKVVHEYVGEQIDLYKDGGDAIFRQLANRSAVYALRAGMLMWFLWGCPGGMRMGEGRVCRNAVMLKIGEFAKWFAEYVQNQQYRYISKPLESIYLSSVQNVRSSYQAIRNIDICARFHGPFTAADYNQMKFTFTKKSDSNPTQTLNRMAERPEIPLVRCEDGHHWEYVHKKV